MRHKAQISFWLDYFTGQGVPKKEAKKLAKNPEPPKVPQNPREVPPWLV